MKQIYLITTFIICLLVQCSSPRKFTKMVKPEKTSGLLYLVRPDHPSLSMWNYECTISKYPSKFSSMVSPKTLFSVNLENASLGYIRLTEGTYRLDVVGKNDATKVFTIKNGEDKYFFLRIFSETRLSKSELTFIETSKEDSLSEILSIIGFTEFDFKLVEVPIE
ncbi:hypothetical protein P3G55_08995 [Leptospira sp. 96542]|nr:hypothetical protein [Leptospira sp. 96542]